MVQIINDPGRAAGLGQSLGTSFGQGLQQLAQQKLQNMIEDRQQKVFEDANIPSGLAKILAKNPQLQKTIFEQLDLSQLGKPQQQGIQQFQQPGLPQMQQMEQQRQIPSAMEAMNLIGSGQLPQEERLMQYLQQAQQPEVQKQDVQEPVQQQLQKPEQKSIFKPSKEELLKKHEQQKEQAEERKEINKEVVPFIQGLRKKDNAAKEADLRLAQMRNLINTGNINHPLFASLVKTITKGIFGIGLDVNFLLTPESQYLDKLSSDFMTNAKDFLPSNFSQGELELFMKRIPDLSQSNEGKLLVARNFEIMNEMAHVKRQIADQLLDRYGSNLPRNFESQVDKLAEPYLKKLGKELETNIKIDKVPGTAEGKAVKFLSGGLI